MTPLHLDERADPGSVPDAAAIEIRESVHHHVLAELDVVQQPVGRMIDRRGHCGAR